VRVLVITVLFLMVTVVAVLYSRATTRRLVKLPQVEMQGSVADASNGMTASVALTDEVSRKPVLRSGDLAAEGERRSQRLAVAAPTLSFIETLETDDGRKRIAHLRDEDGRPFTIELKPAPPAQTGDLSPGALLEGDFLTQFHSNGVVSEAGPYLNGFKQGGWSYWSEEGVLILDGVYLDGAAEGLWRQWHDNGVLAALATASKGQFNGQCNFWNPDGTPDMKRTGWYEAGEKIR
jgi:hypothetical protein